MFHLPSHIDRYEIKTLIGAGGMGSLYLARDTNPNTNRLVAVKLLLANLDSGDLRERFAREARALAALNHPNIVGIYDSGEFQGSPFIVMEYVRGETVGEKIKRRAPMTLGQRLRLMIELCSGLEHAHDAGIIHRDIKPANLMIDQHGRLKILDFGIARVSESLTRVGVQVTQLNMRIGTPGYMSPEQIEGGELDRRSDIFAVGTVCYELLAYREAFTGASTRQVENKVLEAHPEPLHGFIPDLDPEIEGIVTRALAKEPADRYQTAAEMEQALERVRWRLGPEPPTPSPKATPNPSWLPSRKSRDSRADAAYLRSQALYAEGAHDAARRFAVEALAEDPDHEDARTFVERFGARGWPAVPARTAAAYTASGPTVLRTGSRPGETGTSDAETVLSPASGSSRRSSRSGAGPWWVRHQKPLILAGLVLAVGVVSVGAVYLARSIWSPGPVLTITPPEGGTIQGRGINCGTAGGNCSTPLTSGSLIDLLPIPDEGYLFDRFTGDCPSSGRTTVEESMTCGAIFNRIPEQPAAPGMLLTIIPPQGGTIIGEGIACGAVGNDCVAEYPQGKAVVLEALSNQDYTFRGFTGDCQGRPGQSKGEVLMSAERRCGATFVASRSASGGGGRGTPPPPGPAPRPSTPAPGSPSGGGGSGSGGVRTPDPIDRPPAPLPVPETEPPAPPPTPPKPSAEERAKAAAKADIQDLLNAYRLAYESLDVERIQRVYPSAPVEAFENAFRNYKALEYTYTAPPEFIDLDAALGTATVKVPGMLKVDMRVGRAPPRALTNLFTLKRNASTWGIVDVRPTK